MFCFNKFFKVFLIFASFSGKQVKAPVFPEVPLDQDQELCDHVNVDLEATLENIDHLREKLVITMDVIEDNISILPWLTEPYFKGLTILRQLTKIEEQCRVYLEFENPACFNRELLRILKEVAHSHSELFLLNEELSLLMVTEINGLTETIELRRTPE